MTDIILYLWSFKARNDGEQFLIGIVAETKDEAEVYMPTQMEDWEHIQFLGLDDHPDIKKGVAYVTKLT